MEKFCIRQFCFATSIMTLMLTRQEEGKIENANAKQRNEDWHFAVRGNFGGEKQKHTSGVNISFLPEPQELSWL